MRKLVISAAALAILATSLPAIAQQSSVKANGYWTAARIDVADGQFENYMDYLTKVWAPNQEYAKSQGWVSEYHILSTMNARQGEPEIVLVTRFADFPSIAEQERRNKVMNDRMKQDDHAAETASGQRTKMRELSGSVMYQELTKR